MSTQTNNPSKFIYHHTDHGGVVGILSNETFRFSAIDYLNDSAERTHVHSYINDRIAQEADRYKGEENVLFLLDEMRKQNNMAHTMQQSLKYYVGCFTESINELSHWRGYSRAVPGYAIAFRRDELVDTTKQIMTAEKAGAVRAEAVTYVGPKHGESLVDQFIQSRIRAAQHWIEQGRKAELDGSRYDVKYEIGHVADSLSIDFFQRYRSAFFKHDAFHEEEEFRIAINLFREPSVSNLGNLLKFGVTAGAATMKPYVELSYKGGMRLLIDRMIVGPTPEEELACRALEAYRASLGYDFRVEYCNLPFRPGW